MPRKPKYDDLREACVQEAMSIIETNGLEQLSLREVSRRLGVSHQAPYKHFPSRDHILAEVVRRTFVAFAHYLDARALTGDAHHDLESLGRTYLQYALAHPLQYRLMFGTPLPNAADHPEMMQSAQVAFNHLRDCIARMTLTTQAELDALFVWSTMHGIASIMQTQVMDTLALPEHVLEQATEHIMRCIDAALVPRGADSE